MVAPMQVLLGHPRTHFSWARYAERVHDYRLVGCGHCGAGVVPRLAPICPFRQEPVCDGCYAEVLQLVTDLQAKGHDPLPKPRRRGGTRMRMLA